MSIIGINASVSDKCRSTCHFVDLVQSSISTIIHLKGIELTIGIASKGNHVHAHVTHIICFTCVQIDCVK